MEPVFISFLAYLFLCAWVGNIAKINKRDSEAGFFLAFFITPLIAIIILRLIVPNYRESYALKRIANEHL